MGLFSSKKKISVSSVVYNLAGDEKNRVQYLPTAVVGSVITGNNLDMADAIRGSLLSGPGIKMRSFGRWARTSGFTSYIGQIGGQLITGSNIDINDLSAQIPVPAGKSISIQTAEIGAADYSFWADQWLLDNHPEQINDDYELDFSEVINTVYLRFPDGSSYSFNPVGFTPQARYLYVAYTITDPPSNGPVATGSVVSVGSPAEYPDTSGWTADGTVSTPSSLSLTKTVHTVVSYSDSRPNEDSTTTTPSTGAFNALDSQYEKKTYNGQVVGSLDQISATKHFQHNLETRVVGSSTATTVTTETITGGVIKTTTVTTTTESLVPAYSYRIDTQEIIEKGWSDMHVLIYQQGTGNAVLDAMFNTPLGNGDYYPFIPLRLNNTFVSSSYLPEQYALNKKAYKKAIGGRADYDKLIDNIKDNDSIGDIDYAYVVYAVSLNTKENASKKYVYKFFQALMAQGSGGITEYNNWKVQWNIANNSALAWMSWKEAQSIPGNPLFGTVEPAQIPYPEMTVKRMTLQSNTRQYHMSLSWSSMQESTHSGLGKPDVKVGELWWTQGSTETFEEVYRGGRETSGWFTRTITREFVSLNWQDGANTWRTVSMWGLEHANVIYGGKGVDIKAKDALADTEESGFLVPLHENILRTMSLKDSTQMATACTYIVFNCYQVTKQKWYQSSWFKIVLIVVAIVIVVVTLGSGTPVSAGLLGTAAAVGTALGFAGVAAIIVGAIANALAAMLLTKIITMGATALFGEKVGLVVGAIASVIAVAYGSGTMSTTSMASSFSSLATAQNLMALTLSAGNGYAGYINAGTQDILNQTEDLLANYQSESLAIAAAYTANLGDGSSVAIDPTQLTSASRSFFPESSNAFLSRTLLVGGDIADLTNTMLTNFANMTLTTELPV